MKLKLYKIVNATPALNRLQTQPVPGPVAYRIMRIADKLAPIIKTYQDTFNAILKKYGVPVEGEEGRFSFSAEAGAKFQAESTELSEQEEEIEVGRLKQVDLESITLTVEEMRAILPFVED